MKVIFYVPFTGKRTETGFKGQEWYDWRYKIFKNYTLQSLVAQTDKNFFLWLTFRPEEKTNPTTKKIEKAVKETGIDYKMTFHGINFIDDMQPERNKDLEERYAKMIKEIPHFEEEIYEVMLDSDDMLHKDYVMEIKKKPFKERGAVNLREGYIYDPVNDRLARWTTPTCNQNYMIMFPNNVYYNAKKRLEYLKGLESHEQVPVLFNAEEMVGMFCSATHGQNMSTVWGHQFMGEEIYDENVKQGVLSYFGIKI